MIIGSQVIPLARSSSISKSLSFADIDRYKAVTEYRLDCRADLEPSCEEIVFCRETGWKEDDEAVDARDGACNMTDILPIWHAAYVVGGVRLYEVVSDVGGWLSSTSKNKGFNLVCTAVDAPTLTERQFVTIEELREAYEFATWWNVINWLVKGIAAEVILHWIAGNSLNMSEISIVVSSSDASVSYKM